MNSTPRLQRFGVAAGIALASGLLQSLRLPAVLGGPSLGVVAGRIVDPHALTWWLDRAVFGSCGLSAPCVHYANATIFAAVVFAIAALWSSRPFGLLAAACVGISPLADAATADALGATASVGVLLVAVAAFDVVGQMDVPRIARSGLAAALALLDPCLLPAALAYGAFGGAMPFACAAIATAIRLLLFLPAPDALATPATLVLGGAALFVGGPLAMLATRYGAFRTLDDGGRALLRSVALASACVVGGLFAATGDPAAAWLAAECAVLAGLIASVGARFDAPGRALQLAAGGVLAVQIVAFIVYHASGTTAAVAYRGDDLRGMLATAATRTCVAADDVANHYVLASGEFLAAYRPQVAPAIVDDAADCLRFPASTAVVTMKGLAVNDWGQAIPLMQAFRDASDPKGVLATEGGSVTPHTHAATPTGRGAFGNMVDSALGRVVDFTVLSGFTYAPPCVRVGNGQRLNFSAASVPGSPDLPISVVARASGRTVALLATTFRSSPSGEPYRWIRFSLPAPASDCTTFAFAVRRNGGQASSWLTFAGAAVR